MSFKKIINFTIATLLIVSSNVFAQQVTKVIDLNPTLPAGVKTVSGSCWTYSIAVNRQDAWRCIVGNSIMDPCFTTSSSKNKLVCDMDPVTGKSGVILKLTKPLPVLNIMRTTQVRPWIIKLTDGSVCRPYTGTMPITDKGGVSYYCTSSNKNLDKNCYAGLMMDSIMEGKIWTAEKVVYCSSKTSQTGLAAMQVNSINVTTVWR